MEGQDQESISKVIEVNSKETWDLYVSQATTQGSPVSIYTYLLLPLNLVDLCL